MSKYNVKILGFGDNVVDQYEHTKTMYPGGNCVNLCAYSVMFGAEKAAYMGYFGNDENAEYVISVLDKMKIETYKCKQIEGENGWSRVTLKDGDRIFVGCNEGGVRGKNKYVLDRFDLAYMKQFDIIHTGNYCFTEDELPKIHKNGMTLSFDFSDDSDDKYYQRVAPNVDYAFCSFDGSDEEVKKHLEKVHSYGPKLVAASRGSKGCVLYDGALFYEQKAIPIEKVVDTMGAGDSLITSFLIGYTDRIKKGLKSEEAIKPALQDAAEFASKICGIEGAFGYGKHFEP